MGVDQPLRLDEQLLLFMDQLEALEEKRLKLNSLIEEGWFSIAKARYSMGNKQVSALQYASEMEPLVYVETSALEGGTAEFKCERKENKTEDLKNNTIEDIGAKETGLRRRINTKQKEVKEEEQETDPQVKTKAESPTLEHRDPLKWFGILVPQNLKQAQSAFKEVITLSAEIATLQSAILATRKEMQAQTKEKQEKTEKTQPEMKKE
ncbi:coiled-coil domain-containing protein 115 [Labeo rohita]|uniref:Vacuolar ATPase assembly protein VMA22 n=2 Tax=Labeo rohita TaxID=84645 RepID=A0A498L2N8_LABRO|nr:coiled-coil domain-containing protein 115 [Labeo rohita]KAI2649821.1 Coiled-coil domain-containing protein 115 [Labeo rohita]RXN02700.1 coiled-coil domain-containing protein 115 [Labeo rohita]